MAFYIFVWRWGEDKESAFRMMEVHLKERS